MNEDFDGSALRGLLEPAVAGRGAAAPPTDAIVASGQRRVLGRRAAVAGGALAIVAAVPLAATWLGAGPGSAKTSAAATGGGATPPVLHTTPGAAAAPPAGTTLSTSPQKVTSGSLPATPKVLASGKVDGLAWSVAGVASAGNNTLTAEKRCLKLLITADGKQNVSLGNDLLYCLPVSEGRNPNAYQAVPLDEVPAGSGLAVGTVAARVAKIVVHIDGVGAATTVDTLPAPGAGTLAVYVVPFSKSAGFSATFDEFDAHGTKIGTFTNHPGADGMFAGAAKE
ncbi:hypothetical protein [Catenulispora subtropica]|uniref:Uncharacterized protein n=1 Tax=Catenulispora subtropica TaxID=450798 RepID=A0ABN2TDX6_9ACTN